MSYVKGPTMTNNDTFQRLLGPSEAARRMLEQIETQRTFGNSLAITENAIKQLSQRQALIDNFTTSSSTAVEPMLERYGPATQRPLVSDVSAYGPDLVLV